MSNSLPCSQYTQLPSGSIGKAQWHTELSPRNHHQECMKYFDRLLPGDLITVVDAVTFSPKAVTKVTKDSFT